MSVTPSNKRTAIAAQQFMCKKDPAFAIPSAKLKRALSVEYARQGRMVYGQAFDLMWVDPRIDLSGDDALARALPMIRLYEVKSSNRKLKAGFAGYFFSLSTAELLTAQSLGENYRFLFVNEQISEILDLSLREVFARARAIYPSWSIKF